MHGIIERLAQHRADLVAVSALDRQDLTYAQLVDQIRRIGGDLISLGLTDNDRVAVVLPNGPVMAAAFMSLAPWCSVAPLNPYYTQGEFKFYLQDLEAKALLVQRGSDTVARKVAKSLQVQILEIDECEHAGSFTLTNSRHEAVVREIDRISLILPHLGNHLPTENASPIAKESMPVRAEHRRHVSSHVCRPLHEHHASFSHPWADGSSVGFVLCWWECLLYAWL